MNSKTTTTLPILAVISPPNLEIFYADYTYEEYSGDCYVLGYDKREKKWFEVHGNHCSCYGLEGQWDEEYYDSEEQLLKVIELRLQRRGYYGRYAYSSNELIEWLNS